jgi:hypothetical protein
VLSTFLTSKLKGSIVVASLYGIFSKSVPLSSSIQKRRVLEITLREMSGSYLFKYLPTPMCVYMLLAILNPPPSAEASLIYHQPQMRLLLEEGGERIILPAYSLRFYQVN